MTRTANGNRHAFGLAGLMVAALALTGCDDAPAFLKSADAPANATGSSTKSTRLVEQDAEAPEVFKAEEAGLWDGRPSLGGVWVAHPDVTDPQRVLIRNTANNKEVVGALFRRERDIPGPRIQASSDAAEALSMLAGAPVKLSVVALVREQSQAEPETAQDTPTGQATEPQDETMAAPVAEALEPVEDNADSATADSPIPSAPAEPESTRKFRWPWSKPDPVPVAAATAAVAEAAAPAPIRAEPLQQASELEKPYIQIGIFSVEANADRAATQMRAAGLKPTVYEQSSDDRKFWRVVIGPAKTETQRSNLMQTVKTTGFSDAYFVTN
ncbi:SPOR domain-containing protein [Rhodobacteraceae bacterium F11138]|nr:SPOR domain-containing protein [Rhodobacteraceae bacterium F11138]